MGSEKLVSTPVVKIVSRTQVMLLHGFLKSNGTPSMLKLYHSSTLSGREIFTLQITKSETDLPTEMDSTNLDISGLRLLRRICWNLTSTTQLIRVEVEVIPAISPDGVKMQLIVTPRSNNPKYIKANFSLVKLDSDSKTEIADVMLRVTTINALMYKCRDLLGPNIKIATLQSTRSGKALLESFKRM
jgi:hypothetical protein